jgi:hypothetical protein
MTSFDDRDNATKQRVRAGTVSKNQTQHALKGYKNAASIIH